MFKRKAKKKCKLKMLKSLIVVVDNHDKLVEHLAGFNAVQQKKPFS
jgi:hypothetical protein